MRPLSLDGLVSKLRRRVSEALASTPADAGERAADGGDGREVPVETAEAGEFGDLLAELAAVQGPADPATALALKDATIAALRGNLEQLRPMGEEFAAATIWRTSAEAVLASLAGLCAELQARADAPREAAGEREGVVQRVVELELELGQHATAARRLEERLEAMRAKYEERRKVAAERWREIQSLRSERRRLERELEQERLLRADLHAPLRALVEGEAESIPRQRLSDLFRLVAPAECAGAPAPPRIEQPTTREP